MATRQIIYCNGGMIKKVVPHFDELKGKNFPSAASFAMEPELKAEEIYNLLKGTSLLCQSAIIQQYNEYYINNENRKNENLCIAPIQFVSTDEYGLPILGFPYFRPLVESDVFYKYVEEENLIKLGMEAQKFGVEFKEVKSFYYNIIDLCNEFDLREEDIIYNLSNIGYNEKYGLRVIDYGLVNSSIGRKFELVL